MHLRPMSSVGYVDVKSCNVMYLRCAEEATGEKGRRVPCAPDDPLCAGPHWTDMRPPVAGTLTATSDQLGQPGFGPAVS